jgi:hypothetical protein
MGKNGSSVVEMAAELDVVRDTLYELAKVHPDFSDAFTRARQWSQVWWERKGVTGLDQSGFNSSVWSRSMAARFPADYTEKRQQELSGPNGGAIQHEANVTLEPGDAYRRLLDAGLG